MYTRLDRRLFHRDHFERFGSAAVLGRCNLLARELLLLRLQLLVTGAFNLARPFHGKHAGLNPMSFQFQADLALDSLQRPGHVVCPIQILSLQFRPFLEILRGLFGTAKSFQRQTAEVVAPRVLRPALDCFGQHFVGTQVVLRKERVNATAIHLRQHGILCRQQGRQNSAQQQGRSYR